MSLVSSALPANGSVFVTPAQAVDVVARACPAKDYRGKRVIVVVPDGTRTAPVGLMFKTLFAQIGEATASFDIIIALGTHQPMSEEAICGRLEITAEERRSTYAKVKFFNHDWNNPAALRSVGKLTKSDIRELSDGRFEMEVDVQINKLVFDYDQIVIVGPVFPHEVVGFSGGNKYLFPGIGGPDILNFFHWLGAVVTNPLTIGNKWTPVRKTVDKAATLVPVSKLCFCMVVAPDKSLVGLYAGSPEKAWDAASDLSDRHHVVYKEKPFKTVLSVMPAMYDELWVGGKGMYKLEPVVADGGELIIYAPHIHEISATHGETIRKIGYHCRDYFLKQWDQFKHFQWGVVAHSTHVRGIGTYENGVEKCRIQVTLATGIPEALCKQINLGYRDPKSIYPADFANREAEGVLLVPKAGEMLFRLKDAPEWCRKM